MPATPRRPFTVRDALILIGALAVGLALTRAALAGRPLDRTHWVHSVAVGLTAASPCAGAMSLALLALRLVRPRPGLRRLARQPGLVACAVFAVDSILVALFAMTNRTGGRFFFADAMWILHGQWVLRTNYFWPQAGSAVGGAWIALALGGRWKAEPSWIDRAGRALGVYWIATYLFLWSFAFWIC
jgi:hypothetical protein